MQMRLYRTEAGASRLSLGATVSRLWESHHERSAFAPPVLFAGSAMSLRTIIASLCGTALAAACGHRAVPTPAAEVARDPGCPHPAAVAQQDSGIDLGRDVSRRPRYRVDSSGQVETLPPVPAAGNDTAKPGCPASPDTSRDSSSP
jgi:hypothetical protein